MIDSSIQTFQQDVIEASREKPVLVDFWAPWCGPCRTLGPMLEKLETEYAGQWTLVKVNSDENPELSQAFRIRSIPYVVAFVDGRPVDQFMGALAEGQLREFIDRLIPNPSQIEHLRGRELAEQGDLPGALAALQAALAIDATNDDARLDLIALLLDAQDTAAAQAQLASLAPITRADAELAPHIDALTARLDALKAARQLPSSPELERRILDNPGDLAARLDLAKLYIAHQAYEEALEQLIEIVLRDRQYDDDVGRRTMIQVFDLASSNPELVSRYRRRLSSAVLK